MLSLAVMHVYYLQRSFEPVFSKN